MSHQLHATQPTRMNESQNYRYPTTLQNPSLVSRVHVARGTVHMEAGF